MSTETKRCTGHCCRAFTLPAVEELRRYVDDGLAHPLDRQVPDMLVLIAPPDDRGPAPLGQYWYTCLNFDAATGDCRVYETRPRMCRDFPYRGEPCHFIGKGCTLHAEEPARPAEKFESVDVLEALDV